MALEKSERYLLIGIDEDSEWAQVTSFIRKYTTFLDKRCKQYPKSYKHVSDQFDGEGDLVGKEFICDKNLITFRSPRENKMTEEEKKIKVEKMQKARKKKVKKD